MRKQRWFDDNKYTKYRLIRFIRTRRLAIQAYRNVVRGAKTPLSQSANPPSESLQTRGSYGG